MFVTTTDFDVPPLDLPNLDKVDNSFADFVTEQEEEHLSRLFGVRFWEAFKDGLEALPEDWAVGTDYVIGNTVVYADKVWNAIADSTGVVPGTDPLTWEDTENIWIALKAGAIYTFEDVTYKWAGMTALVKPLIYSLWLKFAINDQVSGVGNVKGKAENADIVSPNTRMCRTWNQYDDLACGKLDGGTRWTFIPNSLFGYLTANTTDFDSVVAPEYSSFDVYLSEQFSGPGRMNIFDL